MFAMMVPNELTARFEEARRLCLSALPQRDGGIGTLGERTLHRMLKLTWEPSAAYHEIPVTGGVADIFRDGEVIEIQTRAMERLLPKLTALLPLYPVTVVLPLPHEKRLHRVNTESGEIGKGRKSPKKGRVYDAFWELYKLRRVISHPHLRIQILLLDVEEYRTEAVGRRRRGERLERIPTRPIALFTLEDAASYAETFLPEGLADPFTVKEYAKAVSLPTRYAALGISLLCERGVLERVGKEGRAYLYRCKEIVFSPQ